MTRPLKIINDSNVPLVYIESLVQQIVKNIELKNELKLINISSDIEIKVSEVLRILKYFKDSYLIDNTLPLFNNSFEFNLFNTFRGYIDLEKTFPIYLKKESDERGFFSEIIRSEIGGQFSFSTTLPGVTRGNHFHTRKIERFTVLKGKLKFLCVKLEMIKSINFY